MESTATPTRFKLNSAIFKHEGGTETPGRSVRQSVKIYKVYQTTSNPEIKFHVNAQLCIERYLSYSDCTVEGGGETTSRSRNRSGTSSNSVKTRSKPGTRHEEEGTGMEKKSAVASMPRVSHQHHTNPTQPNHFAQTTCNRENVNRPSGNGGRDSSKARSNKIQERALERER